MIAAPSPENSPSAHPLFLIAVICGGILGAIVVLAGAMVSAKNDELLEMDRHLSLISHENQGNACEAAVHVWSGLMAKSTFVEIDRERVIEKLREVLTGSEGDLRVLLQGVIAQTETAGLAGVSDRIRREKAGPSVAPATAIVVKMLAQTENPNVRRRMYNVLATAVSIQDEVIIPLKHLRQNETDAAIVQAADLALANAIRHATALSTDWVDSVVESVLRADHEHARELLQSMGERAGSALSRLREELTMGYIQADPSILLLLQDSAPYASASDFEQCKSWLAEIAKRKNIYGMQTMEATMAEEVLSQICSRRREIVAGRPTKSDRDALDFLRHLESE
jgi:hypothetical protein